MSVETARGRIDELLLDRAIVGLAPSEELELERLAAESGIELDPRYDLTAAALDLALAELAEPMPAAVRARLDACAREFLPTASVLVTPPSGSPRSAALPRATTRRTPALAPWLVAAAAVVLALLAWRQRTGGELDPAELRAELAARPGAFRAEWTATELASGAGGDVVWSQADQAGVLRIRGLAANDPAREQYQLWIFDDAQEHPVDGGVFDVRGDGETLVPIDAKLPVGRPTLFAVTREKPGGVVVSDRQRIVLVAEG